MFFQGDEFGAQNDFRWGNPSTWDNDWNWQSLGKDWDWTKVTFNDTQKATYERLFTLPPQRATQDAAYKAWRRRTSRCSTPSRRCAGGPRTEAMLNITQRQQFQFYKDAIAPEELEPGVQRHGGGEPGVHAQR